MASSFTRPLTDIVTVVPRLMLPMLQQLDEVWAGRSIELARDAVSEAERRKSLRRALDLTVQSEDRHSAA